MKARMVLATAILVLAVGIAPAQDVQARMPWHAPVPDVEEGAQLIAIGFWGDVVGIGFMAGSSAAYSISFGAGQTLFELGLTSMLLVGNICMNKGLNQHHEAIEANGFDVSEENREKSVRFSKIALGCGGGAVALGIGAAATQSLGLAIASIVTGGAGAVFEIINFYNYRPAWANDMRDAVGLPPMGPAAAK